MKFASKDNYSFLNYSNFNIKSEKLPRFIYNCSVINKYLIVGKHLLTTFLVEVFHYVVNQTCARVETARDKVNSKNIIPRKFSK
jgi:hypothetical protein